MRRKYGNPIRIYARWGFLYFRHRAPARDRDEAKQN